MFRQVFEKLLNFYQVQELFDLMEDHLKSERIRLPFDVNWKIREIFSEAALSSFFNEQEKRISDIDKKS